MYKKRDLDDLIGETIDKKYKLESLIRQTSKSWVFKAIEQGEISPHRSVALKILKPGQDIEREFQFKREVDRLANLEHHPNITIVYNAGKDKELFYVAMELVPGKDLAQEIEAGKKFSLEEILNIVIDITDTVNHIHKKVGEHQDIKLNNIKVREEGKNKKTYVLDLGGRLKLAEDSKDVLRICSIFKELLSYQENPEQKVPRGLEKIIKKSTISEDCPSPEEFKNAIGDYKKNISRRKFLKIAGSVGLGTALIGYGINKYIKSPKIHYKLEDIVHEIQLKKDFDVSLYQELLRELYKVKIIPLIETVPKGQFPFKVNDSGKYESVANCYNDQGEWIRAIALGYVLTKDESYLKGAIERNKFLKITRDEKKKLTEMDELGINLIRITRANMYIIDLIEQSGLEKKYKNIKNELDDEIQEVVDIFIKNKYRESNLGGYFIMSSYLDENLPESPGKSVIRNGAIDILESMWRFADKSLQNKLFNHIRLSNKYLFRKDGSVRDAALIDDKTGDFLERNIFGWLRGDFEPKESTKSCYNWTLMSFLLGLEYAYPYLNDEDKQIIAENIKNSLNFYMNNFNLLKEKEFFKERFLLPVDFYDIRLQNKETWPEIKINNYPLVLSLKVLTDALNIIENEKFKNKISDTLIYTAKNLTRCIPISKDIQGIICDVADTERHLGENTFNYYMFADSNYLEYLYCFINNKKLI